MPNNTYKRTRNLFDPQSKLPYKLSRSRLENFTRCPRCFYLDRRLGVDQPGSPPYTLNSAVDTLLKKEFDSYRKRQEPHPLMTSFKIDAIPYSHPLIDEWRNVFNGVRCHHKETNLVIFGAIDDVWVDPKGDLFIVDYKSTSTQAPITLDAAHHQSYKRQMEIYQWLMRHNEFKVSNTGYFVYCNADKANEAFDGRLEFKLEIISYNGDDSWVESGILKAHDCLMSDQIPDYSKDCEFCRYRQGASEFESNSQSKKDYKKQAQTQGELFA